MLAYDLTAEHMTDPIGIDARHPVLSWKCTDGLRQSAYQIRAAAAARLSARSGALRASSFPRRMDGL